MKPFTVNDLADLKEGDVLNSPPLMPGMSKEPVTWTVAKISGDGKKITFDLQAFSIDLCKVVVKVDGKHVLMEEV